MSWNYRMFHRGHVSEQGVFLEDEFYIAEAYYDDDGPDPEKVTSWTDAVGPHGESERELGDVLIDMLAATRKPVIALTPDGKALL